MRAKVSIEDVLSNADAGGFYKKYVKDVKGLAKEVGGWPAKISRKWCMASCLQYILVHLEKPMLVPPHKLQKDFEIGPEQTVRWAKVTITDLQSKMGLTSPKDVDYVTCYINFAKAYLTRKPYEVLPRHFVEAKKNYTKKKELYRKECGETYYRIAAECLLDAGLDVKTVSKTFGLDESWLLQWGYKD